MGILKSSFRKWEPISKFRLKSFLLNIQRTIQAIVRSTSSPEMLASGDLKSGDSLFCTSLLNVNGNPLPSLPSHINRLSLQIMTWEWLKTYMKSYMKYIPSNDKIIFISRNVKIEVFPHCPRTANVKKSRDYGLAVRFAVWGSRLYG